MQLEKTLRFIGFMLAALVCLGYSLFGAHFAKSYICFPFIPFPVFIGEITLIVCLTIMIVVWVRERKKLCLWHYFISGYCIFVIIKTFSGYVAWGPLAFRHAALFYYPLFAVIGYEFYDASFFQWRRPLLISILALFFIKVIPFNPYHVYPIMLLLLVLFLNYPNKPVRYFLITLLIFTAPYSMLISYSRTMFLSFIFSFIFMILGLFLCLSIDRKYKLIGIAVAFMAVSVLLGMGLLNSERFKAMANIIQIGRQFNLYYGVIEKEEASFKSKELKTQLFNPNLDGQPDSNGILTTKTIYTNREIQKIISTKKNDTAKADSKPDNANIPDSKKIDTAVPMPIPAAQTDTHFSWRESNITFRLLIWKDILSDIFSCRPLFGFKFGKPFRSKNIEILRWAEDEWSRDGWISMHNSYLDILYRAGILGLVFIMSLIALFILMAKKFISNNSVKGIIMLSILVYWFVAANFGEILELPYTAIPVWFLFGLFLNYENSYHT